MKALVKSQRAPGIWLEDVPEPKIGPDDVRIGSARRRSAAPTCTSTCGTTGREDHPGADGLGREYCGEIVELGSEVQGFAVGDRVSGEGHITCGYCRNCRAGRRHLCRNTVGVGVNRPGCFAEYLVIPAFNAFKLPDRSPTRLPGFSTRSATRRTRRCRSTSSARTC